MKSGVYEVLCEFIKRLRQGCLEKLKPGIRAALELGLFSPVADIRRGVVKIMSVYVEKMHESEFL